MITRSLAARGLFATLALMAFAGVGTASASAAGICAKYAPPSASIERILGKGGQAPIEESTFCYIEGDGPQTRIYVGPARKAKEEKAFSLTVYNGRPVITTHPAHLGKGAAEVRSRRGGQIDVFFTRGSHFFTLTGDGATPAQMVALARAVYNKA
ncbi:MAG TPA: hypothetical protein VH061_06120 [Solirubrobacteraceae bacterium]|nr:hypothetical protein [Solirubrobacteraceae bacterium]